MSVRFEITPARREFSTSYGPLFLTCKPVERCTKTRAGLRPALQHPSGRVDSVSTMLSLKHSFQHSPARPACIGRRSLPGLCQAMVKQTSGKRVIALDFDGVVCDSVGESSLSGLKAAARVWPHIFNTPQAEARKGELVEKMRAVRPVIETGYENIVQMRCLFEGTEVDDMLNNWEHILPAKMNEWKLDRSEMVALFGQVRDEWIQADLAGWLAPNRIYAGVGEPVRSAMETDEVYIVTTKQAHYTEILMRDMARIDFPMSRIFSQTVSGRPKGEVLNKLSALHPDATALIFVEDKLGTLEKLYLVDWGYNTVAERSRAALNPRIEVLNEKSFADLLV